VSAASLSGGGARSGLGAPSLGPDAGGQAGALGNLAPLLRRRATELGSAIEQRAISNFKDWLVRALPPPPPARPDALPCTARRLCSL